MASVYFPADAGEDLRGIGDPSVTTEILRLACSELRPPPAQTVLEGTIAGESGMWWRRAVPLRLLDAQERFDLDDVDEFRIQACDYVLVYRLATNDEAINYEISRDTLIVVRVVHNSEMVPLLTRR